MTTYGQICRAYPAMKKLLNCDLPLNKARQIYFAALKLDEYLKFCILQEKKYLCDYNGSFSNDGVLVFKSKDDANEFEIKKEMLYKEAVDLDFLPVILTDEDAKGVRIKASEIYNLHGIVEFE